MDDGSDLVDITATLTGQALILRITGDLDLATCAVADARLREATATLPPPALVVLDLSAIEFLSASGVRILKQLITACSDDGIGSQLVVDPESVVRRVIEITGLDTDAPIFACLEDALGVR